MMKSKIKTLIREPIVLFVLIGSVLYLLQALVFSTDPLARKQIIVSSEQVKQLENGFFQYLDAPPS